MCRAELGAMRLQNKQGRAEARPYKGTGSRRRQAKARPTEAQDAVSAAAEPAVGTNGKQQTRVGLRQKQKAPVFTGAHFSTVLTITHLYLSVKFRMKKSKFFGF